MSLRLITSDCLGALRGLPAESVDAIVTDPPYGLSDYSTTDLQDCLRAWLAGETYRPRLRGFMGREWDAFVPGPEVWRECLRVLKPGGHLMAFAGSRTQHLMALGIELAGFEIRNMIAWCYGSGFPKSKNIALAIDKGEGHPNRGRAIPTASAARPDGTLLTGNPVPPYTPRSEEAVTWAGWGTSLKPAIEPITVARKPLSGTLAQNVLRHGTGAINVDGCRVAAPGEVISNSGRSAEAGRGKGVFGDSGAQQPHQTEGQRLGRWPANLILGHGPGCTLRGVAEVTAAGSDVRGDEPSSPVATVYQGPGTRRPFRAHGEGGVEAVEVWDCAPGCPVAAVGAQSGVSTCPSTVRRGHRGEGFGFRMGEQRAVSHGDTGTASRFFLAFSPDPPDPLLYCPKAARSEREAGCASIPPRTGAEAVGRELGSAGAQSPRAGASRTAGEVHNDHPTVKPIRLMRWLCRLVCPPGGVVLDPFMGSGATGIGALQEGCSFVGIEREPRSAAIAEARILHWTGQRPDAPAPEGSDGIAFAPDGRQVLLFG